MANEPGTSYMRESDSLDNVDQVDDDAGQDEERNVQRHTTQSKSKMSTNGMFDIFMSKLTEVQKELQDLRSQSKGDTSRKRGRSMSTRSSPPPVKKTTVKQSNEKL